MIYEIPDVRSGQKNVLHKFDDDIAATMDMYYSPALSANVQLPAVIFMFGVPDSIIFERFGKKLKDAGQYVSWGELIAASVMARITDQTPRPKNDVYSTLASRAKSATTLQIDGVRIGAGACSGNVPTASTVLVDGSSKLRCSVMYFRETLGQRLTHIHVRQLGSWSEQQALLFRDYLRANPIDVRCYADLKHLLAERYQENRVAYTDAKVPLIWTLLKNAHPWRQKVGWPVPTDL